MKIISLNAWGGREWAALQAWLPGAQPDVLLLQEVIRAPQPSPAWLIYEDPFRRLDQRADLLRDVSAVLPGHQVFFAPAARGPLTDDAGHSYLSEHGIAAWVAPHLVVTDLRHGYAHGAFRPDGWGAEPVPRALQVLRLWEQGADRQVTLGHLHGLRDPAGKGDTPARAAQAQAVLAGLSDVAQEDDAVIVAGDLNVLPDSETFAILRAGGLEDLITRYGITDTRTALYTKTTRFADYTLVNARAAVRSFDVPDQPILSDHRPMILDLAL